jgi:endonuclease/exonuclease/phosphatase (EEP) superfamily protein YafD
VLIGCLSPEVRSYFKDAFTCGLILCAGFSRVAGADIPNTAYGVPSCLAELAQPAGHRERLPQPFGLVSWNIEKGNNPEWLEDLQTQQTSPDLMLLQEAYIPSPFKRLVGPVTYENFSEGYLAGRLQTGVLSVSSVKPQLHCALTAYEPWLTTPKATTITRYGLTGSEQPLLVINAHMVNFEWGVEGFIQQWQEIEQVLEQHNGPLIVAGDFNTWSVERVGVLETVKRRHNLTSVAFYPDFRTAFFGLPLDHVLLRNLNATKAKVLVSTKSDHNSLWVELKFE